MNGGARSKGTLQLPRGWGIFWNGLCLRRAERPSEAEKVKCHVWWMRGQIEVNGGEVCLEGVLFG